MPMCWPTVRCAMRRRPGAALAVQAYHEFDADRIIAEENFGGEMVRFVIRAADANAPVHVISASRGKVLRAEPVSALYEQGLVHHVGRFAVLEDQLCAFTTQGYRGEGSPDHADALVFADQRVDAQGAVRRSWNSIGGRPKDRERQRLLPEQISEKREVDKVVQLRAPEGISGAHGVSGNYYVVGAGRGIAVSLADVDTLVAAGFEALTTELLR